MEIKDNAKIQYLWQKSSINGEYRKITEKHKVEINFNTNNNGFSYVVNNQTFIKNIEQFNSYLVGKITYEITENFFNKIMNAKRWNNIENINIAHRIISNINKTLYDNTNPKDFDYWSNDMGKKLINTSGSCPEQRPLYPTKITITKTWEYAITITSLELKTWEGYLTFKTIVKTNNLLLERK